MGVGCTDLRSAWPPVPRSEVGGSVRNSAISVDPSSPFFLTHAEPGWWSMELAVAVQGNAGSMRAGGVRVVMDTVKM
jgi:hypothetical protein